jgi:hypothetical protein
LANRGRLWDEGNRDTESHALRWRDESRLLRRAPTVGSIVPTV